MMNDWNENQLNEIAEAERWLSRQTPPRVSEDLVPRIQRRVREELTKVHAGDAGSTRWRAWHGAIAAAAALALSVGVGWYSLRFESSEPIRLADSGDSAAIEREVAAFLSALPEADADLVELEELTFGDAWAFDGASLYDAFEQAFAEDDAADRAIDEDDRSSQSPAHRYRNGDLS